MIDQLHIEIAQKSSSCYRSEALMQLTTTFLRNRVTATPGVTYCDEDFNDYIELKEHVIAITICDVNNENAIVDLNKTEVRYHVYRLNKFGCDEEYLQENEEEQLCSGNHWQLPSNEFFGLWESLIYDTNVKRETLNFVETCLLFSDKNVNPNILNWNRVVLLHGPPGTGKTSLCKALAQKLSIRLSNRYPRTQLVEVNSHSLFSKLFSESGKLVMKLFQKIRDIADDPSVLVCVLIDEVESLTHSRTAAFNGTDPSDSIRVVNAILTQLYNIRQLPNVLVLTTSNMTGAIDLAFVDRADIKQFTGPPSMAAIYQIYLSCINELMREEMISPKEQLMTFKMLEVCQFHENESTKRSLELLKLSKKSIGLSGRALPKIPFIAHAIYINADISNIDVFFRAMNSAIIKYINDNETFVVNGHK